MKSSIRTLLLCTISAILAVILLRVYENAQESPDTQNLARLARYDRPVINLPPTRTVNPATLYPNFVNAASEVTPAVVNIKSVVGGAFNDIWSRPDNQQSSSGSGVIISADGLIVTNNHVIEEGADIEVTLDDRREFEAELIGRDPSTDLALLRIEGDALPFASFGNSDSLMIGEWVLAVGNPFDLRSTVTAGIVSAKGRSIDILDDRYSIESFIQTDAAVNPGNSGGALVSTSGKLVGINTAIITRSGRYEGYSFAVPSNLAKKIVDDLLEFGTVQRALLGAGMQDLSAAAASKLGLPNADGVIIREIKMGSGAEDAGLRVGDVIVRAESFKIRDVPGLKEIVGRYRPGSKIEVTYFRKGRLHTVNVTLKDEVNDIKLVSAEHQTLLRDIGFEVRDLDEKELERMPATGVKVVSIFLGSKIDRTRMDPDYIITKVNHKRIRTTEEFIAEVERTKRGEDVLLEGYYEAFNGEYYYAFKR